jgi:putative ABC transport system permease protein
MTFFTRDLPQAFRALTRAPGFTAAAAATLALGIGAATVIFSAVYGLLLAPLPFPDSRRLVSLWEKNPERGWHKNWVARANYLDWRDQCRSFSGMAAYREETLTAILTGSGEPEAVKGSLATASLFAVLGVPPALGRAPRDEEDWKTARAVVVISDGFWRSRFGADPGVVGRSLTLNGDSFEIIGVAAPGFAFPSRQTQYWRTYRWDPADRAKTSFRRAHMLRVVGRLAPGVSLAAADADLEGVAARLERQYPETNRLMGAGVTPLEEWQAGTTRTPLLILLGAVGLLLSIACANVGNLLLARAAGRRKEIAVRAALGAGRLRIARQLLAESAITAALGGILGVAAAAWGLPLLKTLAPAGRADFESIRLAGGVLVFAVVLTAVSALFFGLVPLFRILRLNFGEDLKSSGTGAATSGARTGALSGVLVVGEIALALLLFFGASLAARSFWGLTRVDPGFDVRGRVSAAILLAGYEEDEAVFAFEEALLPRLRALPGVRSAAAATSLPLTDGYWSSDFSVRGRAPGDFGIEVTHNEVSPDFFRSMGTRILRGRDFGPADRKDSAPVALINESLARRYFASEDPIGKQIAFDREPDADSTWYTVVGVVADQRHETLADAPRTVIFTPRAQTARRDMRIVLDTEASPEALAPAVSAAVRALDPQVPIFDVRTLSAIRGSALQRDRFLLLLLALFGASAVLLAIIGVYGVTSHDARLRRREIGIRLAIGAKPSEIQRLVVRRGLRLGLAGASLGALAALACGRAMRPLLFGVAPSDPAPLLGVAALLILVTALACALPARRASRLDPVSVLRSE